MLILRNSPLFPKSCTGTVLLNFLSYWWITSCGVISNCSHSQSLFKVELITSWLNLFNVYQTFFVLMELREHTTPSSWKKTAPKDKYWWSYGRTNNYLFLPQHFKITERGLGRPNYIEPSNFSTCVFLGATKKRPLCCNNLLFLFFLHSGLLRNDGTSKESSSDGRGHSGARISIH